jgi:ubiquinone/menaquinone biosynthesis C-methylase UbiE
MWFVYVLFGTIVAFLAVNVGWRYASRLYRLPCPSFLAFAVSGGPWEWWVGTEQTLDWMQLRPGERVLEIGPGPGRLLIPAARRISPGGEAVGLELQPRMIAKLERRATAAGVSNLQAIQGDASQTFELGDFDLVYLSTVLGEIPERTAALRNAFAALRNGGRLSVTEMWGDPHYQSQATVRRLAESVGFRHEGTFGSRRRFTMNFLKP